MAKFIVTKKPNGLPIYALEDDNGTRVLEHPLGYVSTTSLKKGIRIVRAISQEDKNYDLFEPWDKAYYIFNLRSGSQVMGTSIKYASAKERQEGIELTKKIAHDAEVEDLEKILDRGY